MGSPHGFPANTSLENACTSTEPERGTGNTFSERASTGTEIGIVRRTPREVMTVRARAVGRVPPVDKRMTPEVYRLRTTTMERFGPGAFDGRRLGRPGKWVVDFSADWCPFC